MDEDYKPGWEYTWNIPMAETIQLFRKPDGTFWLIIAHTIYLVEVTEEVAEKLIAANKAAKMAVFPFEIPTSFTQI